MEIVSVTQPDTAEILNIVSVADLKLNMRLTNSVEDDILEACILAAYDWLANPDNGWLNRSLITQEFKATLPGWQKQVWYTDRDRGGPAQQWVPTTVIELPMPPLETVDSIKYRVDDVLTTLATSEYVVTTSGFGKIHRAANVTWPTTLDTHPEAVEIAFTAGYGDGAAVKARCPGIVQAIKLLAGDAFRNREDTYAEPRLVAVDRKIKNGVQFFAGRYRFMNNHA